jgi:hypothetical protein
VATARTEAPALAELESRLRRLVERRLGARVDAVEWLPAEIGLRRFARVHLAQGRPATLVARVEAPEDPAGRPPGAPPEPPLEPIRALLERSGLPVPARLGADEAAGIELLEDVGPLTLAAAAAAADAAERRALYEEACDLVPRLQRIADPGGVAGFGRRFDETLLAYKAELFCEQVLAPGAVSAAAPAPSAAGAPPPPVARAAAATAAGAGAVRDAFRRIAGEVRAAPARLAHRDLQSANVHVRAGRPRGRRLALIDLQGAFLAPPEYDLVCLLRDSYLELPPDELAHQLERIRPRLPDAPGPEEFARRFDLLTLARKAKDLARFLQVARARGDRRFLRFAPATVRYLREAAARAARRDPALARLAEILAALPEQPCAR